MRTLIIEEHREALARFDVLVSPTSPTVAFKVGEKAADPLAMYLSDLLTIPSCMAGLPGLNVPCGLSDGLPVGLQLIGPQLSESALFRAGHAHAGVYLILALVAQVLVDATTLTGLAEWVARGFVPIAALLLPGGFFLSVARPGATEPNRLVALIPAGAVVLAVGLATLGVGLLVAG